MDKLVFAGYKNRDRVFQSVDMSNLSSVISTLRLGAGSGVPHVKYDHDTRMLFLYAKVSSSKHTPSVAMFLRLAI